MASVAAIVADLMLEVGKDAPEIRASLEKAVGDTVIELLNVNDGRFKELGRSVDIAITPPTDVYRLPAEFNTFKSTGAEYDSEGKIVAAVHILPEGDILNRQLNDGQIDDHYCYVNFLVDGPDGRANYLILGDVPSKAMTYRIGYYRKPEVQDADIIREDAIIKHGVRAKRPVYFPNAQTELVIYERRKQGFNDRSERFAPAGVITRPSPRTERHNQMMNKIGRGG